MLMIRANQHAIKFKSFTINNGRFTSTGEIPASLLINIENPFRYICTEWEDYHRDVWIVNSTYDTMNSNCVDFLKNL